MRTPPTLLSALLLMLVHAGIAPMAVAADPESLPVFTSDEAAMNALEKLIKEQSGRDGATIDSIKPFEPLTLKGFVAVGFSAKVSGSAAKVTKFLANLSAQPFCVLPSVTLKTDRRDPILPSVTAGDVRRAPNSVICEIQIRQWYAANDKKANKPKKWRRIANPSKPAAEILDSCNALLPDKGVAIDSFAVQGNVVTLIGRSIHANAGRSFGARLFSSENLSEFIWVWLQRPTMDPRAKDGTAVFRIQGKKPEKKEAAAGDAGEE